MNVSSIAVKTKPEHMEEVMQLINSIDFCEVHFHHADGKIVATVEGQSIDEQMQYLKQIENIPHVYSTSLVYSYCEGELIDAFEGIKNKNDSIPDKLMDT
jgi:nitrate reductase NapD